MRLIDGTIQALPMSNYILERKETFIKVLQEGDNDFLFAMLMDYFDKQPTAYNVDEVVKEVKEISMKWLGEVRTCNVIRAIRKGGVE